MVNRNKAPIGGLFDNGGLDLYQILNYPGPEMYLTEERLLSSPKHDTGGEPNENGLLPHMHWYRKVLRTYDPKTQTIILSKKGSRRLIQNLDESDKEYSHKELEELARTEWLMIRSYEHEIF